MVFGIDRVSCAEDTESRISMCTSGNRFDGNELALGGELLDALGLAVAVALIGLLSSLCRTVCACFWLTDVRPRRISEHADTRTWIDPTRLCSIPRRRHSQA